MDVSTSRGEGDDDKQLKELLTGSAKTNLNLATLKQRTMELCKSLDTILSTLQFHPDKVQWGFMLDQFSVINMKIARMKEQLRPIVKHYAVHPTVLTQENAEVIHLLLATKLLPEMEEEEIDILKEQGVRVGDAPVEGQFVHLDEQVDKLNSLVTHLSQKSELPDSGILDSRGPTRLKINDTSRKISRIVGKLREKRKVPAANKRGGGRGGKNRSQSEVLMNAMLTGEGLRDQHQNQLTSRRRAAK